MGHSENGSKGFYPFPRLYAIMILEDFQNY